MEPVLVPGSHSGLIHYRGHKLKRHKIWLQTEYKIGLKKYGYTGFQYAIASATRDVESVPLIADLLRQLNSRAEQMLSDFGLPPGSSEPFNHVIYTTKRTISGFTTTRTMTLRRRATLLWSNWERRGISVLPRTRSRSGTSFGGSLSRRDPS